MTTKTRLIKMCFVPKSVENAFIERGEDIDKARYLIKSDLSITDQYYDTYMLITSDSVCILSGYENVISDRKNKQSKEEFITTNYEYYNISNIQDVEIERNISTGRLVIKLTNNESITACVFSISEAGRFEKIKERIIKLKNSEDIDDTSLTSLQDEYCPNCNKRYPKPDRKVCPHCHQKKTTFKRLLSMYLEYKKEAITIFLCIIASSVFSILAPFLGNKMFFDDVLNTQGKYFGKVTLIIILMLLVKAMGTLLSSIYGIIVSRVAPSVEYDIKTKIFSSMQYLSLDYFTNKQTGALMSRIESDADRIYWFFVDMVPYFIVSVVQIIGLIAIMAWIDWLLTLLLLVVIIIVSYVIGKLRQRFRKLHRREHKGVKFINEVVSDSLNGQRVVKAFAREEHEIDRFNDKNDFMHTATVDVGNMIGNSFPYIRTVYRIAQVLIFALGAYFAISGNFTLGSLSVLIAYSDMAYNSIEFFLNIGDKYARCVDAASRMFEIMDATPKVKPAENPVHMEKLRGDIELKNVSFEYEVGKPIIKNVSFKVNAGEMFGIVGKTGAGKSTIISLMSRLYDVTDGEITIDGHNVKDISFEDLRRSIGVVSQETYIFMGTIADNIKYARPDATKDEIIEAAKSAYAHDFIMKLADGYDTRVGTGGVSLSGGEKQRISIARAILQRPDILILDEATASMDTQTERKIQTALDSLKQGRTIISIAHRLSTLRDADILAVIDKGELAEMGTHAELIKQKGIYFDLHKLQTESLKFIGAD